ncbi:MAG TPA: hypothetical protein VIV65_00170, partial [Gemmatimonadaceae bacterium]
DAAIIALTGSIDQVPPAFSAKQSGGVRAYDAARRGKPLELAAAQVTVHRWAILERSNARLRVRIECSGGTYVRALGRDLGRLTDSAAHVRALRRTAAGRFSVDDAHDMTALREGRISVVPMREAVRNLPEQALSESERGRVLHGNSVAATILGTRAALLSQTGELAAIAERVGDSWHPTAVFIDG